VSLHDVGGGGDSVKRKGAAALRSSKTVPVDADRALPIPPVVGVTRKMPGPEATVNGTPLLAVPLIVTTTFPLVAVEGTVVRSCVAVQLEDACGDSVECKCAETL